MVTLLADILPSLMLTSLPLESKLRVLFPLSRIVYEEPETVRV